jgi:hypothetical protein
MIRIDLIFPVYIGMIYDTPGVDTMKAAANTVFQGFGFYLNGFTFSDYNQEPVARVAC